MAEIEITNMVMIENPKTGEVLVQDRIKSWKGLSFPGGHVEEGESFVDSAVREIKEETGLDIFNLKSCGVIHWMNNRTFDRYIVFLYKTCDYSGVLLDKTDEGRVFFMSIDKLRNTPSQNGMPDYLTMFLDNGYSEAYGVWNEEKHFDIVYK